MALNWMAGPPSDGKNDGGSHLTGHCYSGGNGAGRYGGTGRGVAQRRPVVRLLRHYDIHLTNAELIEFSQVFRAQSIVLFIGM